jgi:hypothetical protein
MIKQSATPVKTPEEKIAKRRADMPSLYRGIYDKAMSGTSRKAAMQAFCLECMGWQRKEVEHCTSPACPLYPYRPYADGTDVNNVVDSGVESKSDIQGVP